MAQMNKSKDIGRQDQEQGEAVVTTFTQTAQSVETLTMEKLLTAMRAAPNPLMQRGYPGDLFGLRVLPQPDDEWTDLITSEWSAVRLAHPAALRAITIMRRLGFRVSPWASWRRSATISTERPMYMLYGRTLLCSQRQYGAILDRCVS